VGYYLPPLPGLRTALQQQWKWAGSNTAQRVPSQPHQWAL